MIGLLIGFMNTLLEEIWNLHRDVKLLSGFKFLEIHVG